jgi:uncharacterized repeat protein (TIGR01451 family)
MSKFIQSLTLATVIALCAAAAPLHAEVTAKLTASKVVKSDDKETLAAAEQVKPGDVVEYTATYQNTGKSAVNNVKASLPIPQGMEFMPDSTRPGDAMASVDGTNFAKVPLKRTVKGPDGKMVEQLVPYSQYRALRWNLGEIAGGASKAVSARMKVKGPISK